MGECSGLLKRKIRKPSLLADADRVQEFEAEAMDRHAALFAEFGLEAPDPNDASHPSWRLLALALARRHVPAFLPDRGRPSDIDSGREVLRLHLASRAHRLVHGGSVAESDRWAAGHFGVDYAEMKPRLNEFRRGKENPFRDRSGLDMAVDDVVREIMRLDLIRDGIAVMKDILHDPAAEEAMRDAIQRAVVAGKAEALALAIGQMAEHQRPDIRQSAENSARMKVAAMMFPQDDPKFDAMVEDEIARRSSWPYA